jgi:hypothetical protein
MLCAGEALTDMIHQGGEQWVSRVGGSYGTWRARWRCWASPPPSPAPSARTASATPCGPPAEVGLDLRLLQRVERSPLLAVVEQGEPPRYFFIGDDSADLHFDAAALPAGWQDSLRWAHFGGISLAREPLASNLVALAEQLNRKGVAISYDPNYRNLMDARYTPVLERMAALAAVIKVSDDDLRGLFPHLGLEEALQRLRAFNPACLLPVHARRPGRQPVPRRAALRRHGAAGGRGGHGRRRRRQRGRPAAQPGAPPGPSAAGAPARRAGGRLRRLPARRRHAAAPDCHAPIVRTAPRRGNVMSRTRSTPFRPALRGLRPRCWPDRAGAGLVPVMTYAAAPAAMPVNTFIGTQDEGNTFPGASAPFGMIQVSPTADHYAGYRYSDKRIRGFGHSYLSGAGCWEQGGQLSVLPVTGSIGPGGDFDTAKPGSFDYKKYAAEYSHEGEVGQAGYYKVQLTSYGGITAEATALTRAAAERYTFAPGTASGHVLLNLGQANERHSVVGSEVKVVDERSVEGKIVTNSFCGGAKYTTWFRIVFDQPVVAHGIWDERGGWPGTNGPSQAGEARPHGVWLSFDLKNGRAVTAVSAISHVDAEGARINLQAEGMAGGRPLAFDAMKAQGASGLAARTGQRAHRRRQQ